MFGIGTVTKRPDILWLIPAQENPQTESRLLVTKRRVGNGCQWVHGFFQGCSEIRFW